MPIFAMPFFATLAFARFACIALIVLGFMVWWPLGLAALAFGIGSGRMGCGLHSGYGDGRWQGKMERLQAKMDWMKSRMNANPCGGSPWGGNPWRAPSSGNRAFDEYRTETLKRLEEEQREFREFLERLRMAKDKAEFDQFMAERRSRPAAETPPQN